MPLTVNNAICNDNNSFLLNSRQLKIGESTTNYNFIESSF